VVNQKSKEKRGKTDAWGRKLLVADAGHAPLSNARLTTSGDGTYPRAAAACPVYSVLQEVRSKPILPCNGKLEDGPHVRANSPERATKSRPSPPGENATYFGPRFQGVRPHPPQCSCRAVFFFISVPSVSNVRIVPASSPPILAIEQKGR
jgi:hypothetical protein